MRLVAQADHVIGRMRDHDDGSAAGAKPIYHFITFRLKCEIADRQIFIHNQDFWIKLRYHCKAQSRQHSGRVEPDLRIDVVLQLGKLNNGIEPAANVGAPKPKNDPVKLDVLAASKILMKAGTEFKQGRHLSLHRNRATSWGDHSGDQAKQGALAGTVSPDECDCSPVLHLERDIIEHETVWLGAPLQMGDIDNRVLETEIGRASCRERV